MTRLPLRRRLGRRARSGASAAVATIVAGLLVAGLAGCSGSGSQAAEPHAAPKQSSSAAPTPRPGAASGIQDPDTSSYGDVPAAGVVPVKVEIPAIGVTSGLEDLAIGSQGELDPPKAWLSAGWYAKGVVPGAVGPAIIAGHIDSPTGPAVFLHLHELKPGDTVRVTLSSGAVETFTVSGSRSALKSQFPTSDVYGTTPTPTLRLITCGGVFNPAIGHYDENLIVSADLTSATKPTH